MTVPRSTALASPESPVAGAVQVPARTRGVAPSLLARALREPRIVVCGSMILLLVLVGLFAPLISPYDPEFMDTSLSLAGSSAAHPLGTDQLGRDVLARLIFGAQLSLQISVYSVAFAFT